MTGQSETKHTPGELSASGRFISAVGSIDTWHGPVHGTIIVCEPTEQTDGDGRNWTAGGSPEANAARIVLTWNCHDELVGALQAARAFIAGEYRDPALEPGGEWLAAEARPTHALICAALAKATSPTP
jgi:hypothetical protein